MRAPGRAEGSKAERASGFLAVFFAGSTFSSRFDCQTRSGLAAISSSVRPVVTLSGRSWTMASALPGTAVSSFSLMRSQFSLSSPARSPCMRTSTQRPWSFSPSRRNLRLPLR